MGQCSLIVRMATAFVRIGCGRKHRVGQELGLNGMVNRCESLINVVSQDKPKVLIGLNQKVSGQVQKLCRLLSPDVVPPADRRDLTHSWYSHGTW